MNAASIGFGGMATAVARLRRAFDARNRRERLLMVGAALAVLWLVADSAWITPAFKHWSAARAREAQATAGLQALQAEIGEHARLARETERQRLAERAQLRERVAAGEARLREAGAALVTARDMVPVLDRLLERSGGLRLRSMQSLGGSAIPGGEAAGATLYRHGVELSVEGSYADLLAYVRAIEGLPQRVLWGGLELKVEQHPKVLLTLRLFTLSQDREWLEI